MRNSPVQSRCSSRHSRRGSSYFSRWRSRCRFSSRPRRAKWAASAPYGALAARTTRVRLPTGVTVLSVLDPVRVAEDYATLGCCGGV
ncbi:LLM class flavin-dependent oxidoreductase, partial [Streptomyces albidoflavus]